MSTKIAGKVLDAIKQDRAKGHSPAEIAARYGVKADFVRYQTRHIRPAKRVFLGDKAEEILLLMGIHNSSRKVAKELGVTQSAINKALACMEWKAAA